MVLVIIDLMVASGRSFFPWVVDDLISFFYIGLNMPILVLAWHFSFLYYKFTYAENGVDLDQIHDQL